MSNSPWDLQPGRDMVAQLHLDVYLSESKLERLAIDRMSTDDIKEQFAFALRVSQWHHHLGQLRDKCIRDFYISPSALKEMLKRIDAHQFPDPPFG